MQADSVTEVLRQQAASLKTKRDALVRQYNEAIHVIEEAISKLGFTEGEVITEGVSYGVNVTGTQAERSNAEFIRLLYEHGEITQGAMLKRTRHFKSGGGIYSAEMRLTGAGLVHRVGKEGRSPVYGLTDEGRRVAEQVFGSDYPATTPEPTPEPVATTPPKRPKRKRGGRRKPVDRAAISRRVLEFISENPRTRPADVKRALAHEEKLASEPVIRRAINNLVQRGLVSRVIVDPRHHQLMVRRMGEFGGSLRPGEPTDLSGEKRPEPESEVHSDPRPAWAR